MHIKVIKVPVSKDKEVDISRGGIFAYLGDKNSIVTRNKVNFKLDNGIPGTGFYTTAKVTVVNPYFIIGTSLLYCLGFSMLSLIAANSDYSLEIFLDNCFSTLNILYILLFLAIITITTFGVYYYKTQLCDRYRKYCSRLDEEIVRVKSAIDSESGIKHDILSSYLNCMNIEKEIAKAEPVLFALDNYYSDKYSASKQEYLERVNKLYSSLQDARYKMDDSLSEFEMSNYQHLCESFELVATASRFWDISSLTNPSNLRHWIRITFGTGIFDYIYSNSYPPIMQTSKNEKLYIYSKFILFSRSTIDFDIIPLDSVKFEFDYLPGTTECAIISIPSHGIKFSCSDPDDLKFFVDVFEAYKTHSDLKNMRKKDSLLEETALYIILKRRVSHEMIRKHFSLGNARTRRILNQLEQMGIVSPEDQDNMRSIVMWDIEKIRGIIDNYKL